MKKMLKRYYRDVLTGVLMTLSLSFTFFLILNSIRIINLINDEVKVDEYVKCMYVSTELLDAETEQDEKTFEELSRKADLFEILNEETCNVSLYSIALNSKVREGTIRVQYVVSYNESLDRKVVSGEIPNADFTNGCVLITESMLDATESINDKKYIELNGDVYEISGIIRDVSVGQSEREVIIFAGAMSKEQKTKVFSEKTGNKWKTIHIGSNVNNPLNVYKSINDKLNKYGMQLTSHGGLSHSQLEESTRYMNSVLQPIMIFFSFTNVFVVTGIWVKKRLRECAIRKSFGATYDMIMVHLIKEMFKCVIVSVVIGAIIQFVYLRITDNMFYIKLYINKTSAIVMAGVFFIILIIMCYYGKHIKKTEPITAIKRM